MPNRKAYMKKKNNESTDTEANTIVQDINYPYLEDNKLPRSRQCILRVSLLDLFSETCRISKKVFPHMKLSDKLTLFKINYTASKSHKQESLKNDEFCLPVWRFII